MLPIHASPFLDRQALDLLLRGPAALRCIDHCICGKVDDAISPPDKEGLAHLPSL